MIDEFGNAALPKMLAVAGLSVKASYNREEVCKILGISTRTFWSMISDFEPGPDGKPIKPFTLDSFMLHNHRRVPFHELADFICRNRTYTRLHLYVPVDQIPLPF